MPTRTGRAVVAAALAVAAAACGGDDEEAPPGRFGEVTSTVVVVNPVINRGSSTTVMSGSQRADVRIEAARLAPVKTDATGLAVIEGLPTGLVPLRFERGMVSLNVVAEKELYDVVVSVRDDGVREIIPAVRYPVGGQVVVVEPGGNIAAAASRDGAIVVLKPGAYPGGFDVRAEGVLVFGAWAAKEGQLSVIDGPVTVSGGGARFRGLRITGTLTTNANNFSAAFWDLHSANIRGNGVSLLRNRFRAGQASVPSSNAVLVDNENLPAQ